MEPKTALIIGGIYNMAFAFFHLLFWKIFKWEDALNPLDSINRAIIQVLNLCLTFVFFVFGYISIIHASDMLATSIGKTLLAAIAIFWFLRSIEQIIFFGLKSTVSKIFLVLFTAGTALYIHVYVSIFT